MPATWEWEHRHAHAERERVGLHTDIFKIRVLTN